MKTWMSLWTCTRKFLCVMTPIVGCLAPMGARAEDYFAETAYSQSAGQPGDMAPGADKTATSGGCATQISPSGDCGCACDTGCCDDDCCSLIAGAEATFLFPTLHRGGGFNTTVANTTIGTVGNGGADVDNSLLVAPRVWLGVQCDCWGIVARYWSAQGSNVVNVISDPTTDPFTVQSTDSFNAYTADLELQRLVYGRRWTHRISGGIRYGAIDLNTNSTMLAPTVDTLSIATALRGSRFYGTGITTGIFSTRPICGTCWSLYAGGRASALFGNSSGIALTSATAFDAGGVAAAVNGAVDVAGSTTLFIGEIFGGVQWERNLCCSPAKAFVRFGGEWQYWDTNQDGNFAAATSVAAVTDASASANVFARTGVLLDMVGFTVGAGVIY